MVPAPGAGKHPIFVATRGHCGWDSPWQVEAGAQAAFLLDEESSRCTDWEEGAAEGRGEAQGHMCVYVCVSEFAHVSLSACACVYTQVCVCIRVCVCTCSC